MAKKLKAEVKTDDRQLAEAVRASAQQIWQAGLGAFAKAQQEGGELFARLVKDGTDLQQRTHALADAKMQGATEAVSKIADSAGKQAAGSWDKLEQVFEERVARSLKNLGVPTQEDIQALAERIEELDKTLVQFTGKKAAATRTTGTGGKPTARKTATKSSVHKETRKTARAK